MTVRIETGKAESWDIKTAGSADWKSIAYGDGIWIAVSNSGSTFYMAKSTDGGSTWTTLSTSMGSTYTLTSIAYNNNTWIIVGSGGFMARSTDNGDNWTTQIVGSGWISVAYGNNKWIACGDNGAIAISTDDGINWTTTTVYTKVWQCITYANDKWVMVNSSGGSKSKAIATSTDGTNWTLIELSTNTSLYCCAYGNGTWMAAGNGIFTSTDGITWTLKKSSPYIIYGIAYGNNTWIAVCRNQGRFYRSDDNGETWAYKNEGAMDSFYDVKYGNRFIICDRSGRIYVEQSVPQPYILTTKLSGIVKNYILTTKQSGTVKTYI